MKKGTVMIWEMLQDHETLTNARRLKSLRQSEEEISRMLHDTDTFVA